MDFQLEKKLFRDRIVTEWYSRKKQIITERMKKMKASWHGQSCVIVETSNGKKILIDPFINGNPLTNLDASTVTCDVIVITHGHNDHVGDAEAIAKRTGALLISTVEIADFFSKKGLKTHGMQPGGGYQFDFGYLKMTPAIHGSTYETEEESIPLGLAAGIVLHDQGKTIYHAGDTALFSDMKLIGEDFPIDLAFLPIGDNYTMGPKDAAKAVTFLGAKKAVPIHYNTFPLIEQDPVDFTSLLNEGVGIVLQAGDSIGV